MTEDHSDILVTYSAEVGDDADNEKIKKVIAEEAAAVKAAENVVVIISCYT